MANKYTPKSHFFTEESKLDTSTFAEAFGPVKDSETTKYRVTSFVKGLAGEKVKLFAICDGSLLILPQKDAVGNLTGKLNIVIKPSQMNWAPLKIKYFVYRGVEKDDFFDTNFVLKHPIADSPEILTKIWTFFQTLNELSSISDVIFPVNSILQLNNPDETLLDQHFTNSLINCKAGENIGYFEGKVGLDIVLDYGDYQLENQENLFALDLGYARKDEFVFDTSTIINSTSAKVKRYREHINQFIDAAAFWGSHIDGGKILMSNGIEKTNVSEISLILQKYFTKDKIYIYIQENNRSFNYYDTTRKIHGFNGVSGEPYKTNEWPIFIKESDSDKTLLIEYSLNISNKKEERQVSLEVISSKVCYMSKMRSDLDFLLNKNVYFEHNLNVYEPATISIGVGEILPTGINLITTPASVDYIILKGAPNTTQVKKINFTITSNGIERKENLVFYVNAVDVELKFNIKDNKACADLFFINCDFKQEHPLKNYFNYLWIANMKSSLNIDTSVNEMHSCTYDKSRNINLDETIGETAIIQNKVFFDKGKNAAGNTKKRRLYAAVIKNNSNKETEYVDLNIDNPHSTFIKTISNKQDYFLNLFTRNPDFSIYKGTFTDTALGSGALAFVNSLCVFNENSLFKKNSYLFLGITEDEYNLFTVPAGADNIFFDLLEDTTFTSENIRKFKLGFRYEDVTGNINTTIYYPSSDVFLYSLDDLFFFSKEFSEYQNYYNEFAPAKIEFRTLREGLPAPDNISKYDGSFGFDWLRIGDNYYIGSPVGTGGEREYKDSITGGYERNGKRSNALEDISNSYYDSPVEAYKFLQREYYCLPTSKRDDYYFVPFLTLFSKTFSASKNTDANYIIKPPFEASLRIIIDIKENLSKIEFDYDKTIFTLSKNMLLDKAKSTNGKKISNDKYITISCKNDFTTTKLIKVWAYKGTDKKLAGIIMVNPNDAIRRKELDVVCVKVQTNSDIVTVPSHSDYEQGKFEADEIELLYKVLHQVLVVPNLIQIPAYLPLENDTRFQVGGEFVNYQLNTSGAATTGIVIDPSQKNLHKTLKSLFLKNYPEYYGKFINFAFGILGIAKDPTKPFSRTAGAVEHIGVYCTVMASFRGSTTFPHEVIHGLGLYHTHFDESSDYNQPNKKYYYPKYPDLATDKEKATDNIMSYNSDKLTTWQWQKKIIYKYLKK